MHYAARGGSHTLEEYDFSIDSLLVSDMSILNIGSGTRYINITSDNNSVDLIWVLYYEATSNDNLQNFVLTIDGQNIELDKSGTKGYIIIEYSGKDILFQGYGKDSVMGTIGFKK